MLSLDFPSSQHLDLDIDGERFIIINYHWIGCIALIPSVFAFHLLCASASCILFVQPNLSACFMLICSLHLCKCIVLQFIKTSDFSISGIPSNVGLISGTTKNLHNLCFMIDCYTKGVLSNCGIAL